MPNSTGHVDLTIPRESLLRLFVRFLRFGALAWGGPMAQIAMLRQSLVDEERWVSSEHFNRALALYQILPGPEAHELCVYFGMLARGRIGGAVAGLGFMLPGFLLMFVLSWAYVSLGLDVHGELAPIFAAIQAAVIALIVRAVHRIGTHVVNDRWLWAIAIICTGGYLADVHFGLLLVGGGVSYGLVRRGRNIAIATLVAGTLAIVVWYWARTPALMDRTHPEALISQSASLAVLFWAGLKAGALTFGGAYTAIPLVQRDAVVNGGWMSNAQFMDGIALGGLLPAPLIIFTTFVGYLGAGPLGAVVMTFATFLPAFGFTLLAHDALDKLVHDSRIGTVLQGVTAAVVGLIAGTAIDLLGAGIRDLYSGAIFACALAVLFVWNSKLAIPVIVLTAAAAGIARWLSVG